jgi:hypothetical protein
LGDHQGRFLARLQGEYGNYQHDGQQGPDCQSEYVEPVSAHASNAAHFREARVYHLGSTASGKHACDKKRVANEIVAGGTLLNIGTRGADDQNDRNGFWRWA